MNDQKHCKLMISLILLIMSLFMIGCTATTPALLIQSGRVNAGYEKNPDWNLHTGTGRRAYTVKVTFEKSFREIPTVEVSLSMVDFASHVNQRASVHATNVTTDGFDVVFSTWSDTRFFGAIATWIAYGH